MREEALFGVELRHLSALTAVARERSFRGAADSLGYVQSAVSQQVADLERLVGIRLVDRSRGRQKVCLTEPGEILVAHAREILARLGAARADLVSHTQTRDETALKVGVFQCVATGLLPDIIRRLAIVAPDLRVEPVEATRESDLFDMVERGAIDVAFGDLPLQPGAFESCTVLRDPCVLLVQADSDAATAEEQLTPQALDSHRLIALEGCRFLSCVQAWFATQGVELRFALRVAHEATVRALVATGAGSAIVSRLAVDPNDTRTTALQMGEFLPSRKLALYWQSGRQEREALDAFRGVAVAAATDLLDRRRNAVAPQFDPSVALAAA